MKNKISAIVAVVIVLTLVGFWFAKNKEGGKSTGEVVKVGVIGPFSGPLADYGEEIKKGVVAAEVDGMEYIYEDDLCEPAKALSAFQKLADFDKVKFIIGPGCGAPQEVIAPLLAEKGIVAVVPSAASNRLFEQSGGNFFNVQYSLEGEAEYLAQTLTAQGFDSVALISYQNPFSQTLADSFKGAFTGTVAEEVVFTDPNKAVGSEVLKLKGAAIDAIVVMDISFFFQTGYDKLKQYGITAPVYATYVAELPAVRTLVEGVTYSFAGEIAGDEGGVAALSAAAASALGEAIEKCGNDAACVKGELLDSVDFDDNGISTRPFVLKKIEGGKAINIK